MSKAEILLELPKLELADRREIFERICDMEESDLLNGSLPTAEEKALLDRELEAYMCDGVLYPDFTKRPTPDNPVFKLEGISDPNGNVSIRSNKSPGELHARAAGHRAESQGCLCIQSAWVRRQGLYP